jgi:hypothetical protein
MARAHDRQSVTRPVRARFEPGHLAQACLVDAYLRLVPHRRRAGLGPPGPVNYQTVHGSEPARARGQQQQQKEGQRCS